MAEPSQVPPPRAVGAVAAILRRGLGRLRNGGGRRGLAGAALAVAAGFICARLHTPIPWMIGPLFALALGRLGGLPLNAPPGARQLGQWIIGTALGLYFSPQVVMQVATFLPAMLLGSLGAIGIGYAAGWVLTVLGGTDRETAFFATVPGGAMEMSILGERFGARVDQVAVAQSLRILFVVAIIPWTYAVFGWHGADPYLQASGGVHPWPLIILLAATAIGGYVLHRLRAPNAWMLGSFFMAAPLTALGVDLSAMPTEVSNIGQVLIGCALGARFEADFLHRAPRFLVGVVFSVVAAMILSAGLGMGLAHLLSLYPPTMVLATAPGGIAEMCITAKVLQLGVPIVTAFHVTRVILLVSTSAGLFHLLRRTRRGRRVPWSKR